MPPTSTAMGVQRTAVTRGLSFEAAAPFALLATIIVAGITFIPSQIIPLLSTKSFILAIGTIVTLMLYILARLSRGNIILPPPLMLGVLWLPTIAYALSAAFSGVNFSRALFGAGFSPDTLGFMVVASTLGTLAALAFRRAEHYELLLKTILGGALLITVAEVAIVVFGQFIPNTISPSSSVLGTVVDLSAVAGLIVIGALISIRMTVIKGRARLMLLGAMALSLFILALFNARLEWIIIALVSLGLFVEAVMRRSPTSGDSDLEGASMVTEANVSVDEGERSLLFPLIALAVSLFFIMGANLSNMLASSLHVSVLDVRPSWQSTLAVGKQVFSSSPIFGSGPTTFGSEWLKYRDASVNQTPYWNVDFNAGIGFIPTSLISTGTFGILAWLLFAVALLYLGVRSTILNSTADPTSRFVTILSFVATVYLGVIAVTANAGVMTLILLFLFAGIFASVLRYAPGKMQWGVVFSKSPRIGFVIVFALTIVLLGSIVGAYSIVGRYLSQINSITSNVALINGNNAVAAARDPRNSERKSELLSEARAAFGESRSAANNSVSLAPSSDAYRLQSRVAQGLMNTVAIDTSLSAADAQRDFQQELAAGITAALAATRVAPDEYQNWIVLGDLYATVVPLNVEGAYANALSAYQKAVALNPTSALIAYSVAQLHIAEKKFADAKTELKRAISLKQDYTDAIFLLSQLEVQDGNVTEALKASEAAAYFTPNNASILFQVGILRAATGDLNGSMDALKEAVKVDGNFANAHYFLAALYAQKKDYTNAKMHLELIAAISAENATAVAPLIADLAKSKNPFPPNLLSSAPPVK